MIKIKEDTQVSDVMTGGVDTVVKLLDPLNESLDTNSELYKELVKLGVDMSNVDQDSPGTYYNVKISDSQLKKGNYKYIETNSRDFTHSIYQNGKYVIVTAATKDGYINIYKLGPNSKKLLTNSSKFDIYKNSLED